jgi:hypothetical protein
MKGLEAIDGDESDNSDLSQRATLRYNRAVLYIRCCQFSRALTLLQPVYNAREEISLDFGMSGNQTSRLSLPLTVSSYR